MKFRLVSSKVAKGLQIASSPFTHNPQNICCIMLWVMLTCIPGIVTQLGFFGYGTLIQLCWR